MKKNLLIGMFAIAMCLMGAIGCSQKANDQFVVSEETELYGLANPFDIVGEMHNEGLDFIFPQCKQNLKLFQRRR